MPFNKEGEWVNLDPLETYRDFVKKAEVNRGGGGAAWTAEARNRLHDEATRFVMERDGIPLTEEAFYNTREEIGRVLETNYDHAERSGFIKRGLLPQDPGHKPYKHPGD